LDAVGRNPGVGWVSDRAFPRALAGSPRRLALAIAVLAVYGAIAFSWAWPAMMPTPMRVIAHRGDIEHRPENTLESVLAASRSAADGIEFDVQRSADGTWWLLHDDSVDRTTAGTGNLGSMSDTAIAALTVDIGPARSSRSAVHLARLETVLAALREYRGLLIIDNKELAPAAHAELARLIPPDSYMICRSIDGASAAKSVRRDVTTVTLANNVWHPDVDVWLAEAGNGDSWPQSTVTEAFGTLAVFVNLSGSRVITDERPLLDDAQRWGAKFVISNHLEEALAWRDGLGSHFASAP
jgi:glycerophosphoryl diester phosphodiesterase